MTTHIAAAKPPSKAAPRVLFKSDICDTLKARNAVYYKPLSIGFRDVYTRIYKGEPPDEACKVGVEGLKQNQAQAGKRHDGASGKAPQKCEIVGQRVGHEEFAERQRQDTEDPYLITPWSHSKPGILICIAVKWSPLNLDHFLACERVSISRFWTHFLCGFCLHRRRERLSTPRLRRTGPT